MNRSFSSLTFAALLLVGVSTLPAQDKSLSRIPAKAPIVASIKGYDVAPAELAKMLANAVPDLAPKYTKEFSDLLDNVTEGRETKDLRKNAPWYIALTDLASIAETPKVVVMLPVVGYKAFKESFLTKDERKAIKVDGKVESTMLKGELEAFMIDGGDYAILSNSKEELAAFEKVEESIEKILSADSKALFAKSTLALFVNVKTINDAYGQQLRGFKTLIDIGLQGGGANLDKKQIEMAKSAIGTLFQILDDGESFVVGVEFRPDGLNVSLATQFGDASPTGKFLSTQVPTALPDAAKMPAGKMRYMAIAFDFKSSKLLGSAMDTVSGSDSDETVQKTLDEAAAEIEKAEILSAVSLLDLGTGNGSFARYRDPKAAVAGILKLTKALTKNSSLATVALKNKPTIEVGAAKVGDFELTSVELEYDFDKVVAALPEETREAQKAAIEKLSGGAKQTMWFGTDGKVVVMIAAKDTASVKALLEAYIAGKATLADDKAYTATRKNLPIQTTLLMLMETGRTVEVIAAAMKEVSNIQPGALPIEIPELKAPKGEVSYLGFALTLKPRHGTIDLFVPAAAVGTIRRMVGPILGD